MLPGLKREEGKRLEMRYTKVKIADISRSGLVTLRTNEPVNLINDIIDADLLEVNYLKSSEEMVELVDWVVLNQTDTEIKLQLNFTEPLLVSTGDEKDMIEVVLSRALLIPQNNPFSFVPMSQSPQEFKM